MDVIYGLIPFVLVFGFIAVMVFIWMAKRGQFDDLDRAANQIFLDDDDFEPGQGGRRDQQRTADDTSGKGRDGHNAEDEKS